MKSSTDLLERYLDSQSPAGRFQHSYGGSQDENEVTSRLSIKNLVGNAETHDCVNTPDTIHASLVALQHELDTCRARPALATLLFNHQQPPKGQPSCLNSVSQQLTAAQPGPTKTTAPSSVGQMLQDWKQLKSKHAVLLQANSSKHLIRTKSQSQLGSNTHSQCIVPPHPHTTSSNVSCSGASDGKPLISSLHSDSRPHSATCSIDTKPPLQCSYSLPRYSPAPSQSSTYMEPRFPHQPATQRHAQPNCTQAPFQPPDMPVPRHSCSGSCQSSTSATNISNACGNGSYNGVAKAVGLLQRMSKPMRDTATQTDPVCSSWAWDMLSNTTDPAIQTALTLLAQLSEHPQLAATLFSNQVATDCVTLTVQPQTQYVQALHQVSHKTTSEVSTAGEQELCTEPSLQPEYLAAGRQMPVQTDNYYNHNINRSTAAAAGHLSHNSPSSSAWDGFINDANQQATMSNHTSAPPHPITQVQSALHNTPQFSFSNVYKGNTPDKPTFTGQINQHHDVCQAERALSPMQSHLSCSEIALPPLLAARIQHHLKRKARRSTSQTGSVQEPLQLPATSQLKNQQSIVKSFGITTQCSMLEGNCQLPGNESDSSCPSFTSTDE